MHRRRNGEVRRILVGCAFVAPWAIGFCVFTAGPVAASAYLSLTRFPVVAPPKWVGLKNYVDLLGDELFWQSLANTAFMFLELPLSVCLGLGIAVLLNEKVRGISFFRTLFYVPALVPAVATAMLWLWIFNPQYGLLNGALRLFDSPPLMWVPGSGLLKDGLDWLQDPGLSKPSFILMDLWAVGGSMIIYLAALQGVPAHLREAAMLDGANAWQRFRHVTLPAISPVVLFMVVTGMLALFQYFTQAFIMTNPKGGPEHSTLFYALYMYQNAFEFFKMGYACAMAWFLFVLSLIATLIVFKTSARYVYYEEGGR